MRLHEQRDAYKAQVDLVVEGLKEIRDYLNSDKFKEDNYVNRNDILMRLNELDNALFFEQSKMDL